MMRILALPRDSNPYQELLYGEMRQLGVQVSYLGQLTPSRTLNLLLLPFEVTVRSFRGVRLIHLHWVFVFGFPGVRRFPVLGRVAQLWFLLWLRLCRMLHVHLVWTAHNVLPHSPVFADDVSARRALVEACDLVLAHSQSALAELAGLGAVARRSAVIPHGPMGPGQLSRSAGVPAPGGKPRHFLFFGRVREYKGVDDLLAAFTALPSDVEAHLTIAGQCDDPGLRSRLRALAQGGGSRVALRLEHVPEQEVSQVLGAADVVVLPFRQVTTSGSVMLALSHGKPLIVPAHAGLDNVPDRAAVRYDGTTTSLAAALAELSRADDATLTAMSAAASAYSASTTWREIAIRTVAEMASVLGGNTAADSCRRPIIAPWSRLPWVSLFRRGSAGSSETPVTIPFTVALYFCWQILSRRPLLALSSGRWPRIDTRRPQSGYFRALLLESPCWRRSRHLACQ